MELIRWQVMLLVIFATVLLPACIGLECWQCIADDCHLDPSSNHKAVKRECRPGQSCQKVVYQGRDAKTNTDYLSTVRSCSQGECFNHVDNCSEQLLTNPGCMVRHCCNGNNLCNAAPPSEWGRAIVFCSMAFLFCFIFGSRVL